ncbi:WD40 repeat-like protein [Mycena venus]|uniref:WD40 repeat-like protein n=1 Tax=Mycena venus TaxID=2733690 RepID=A0A8H6X2T7_9AGAR|nr:WD40 repeat-like protein [Mycena venus]
MADRSKRSGSSARPGNIVLTAKQKHCTPDEKAADEISKEQAKAAKEQATIEAHDAGVQRVAQKEGALRAEDDLARKNSTRLDLATAELKRKIVEKDMDVAMDAGSDHGKHFNAMDDDSDDESFQPDDEAAYQEFLAFKKKKAGKGKAKRGPKVAKSVIRTEINEAAGFTANKNSLKHKPSGSTAKVEPKKSKTAIGGLKKGWQKVLLAVTKPSKTSTPVASTRTDSISVPRGRTESMPSNVSMPSLCSVSHSTMSSVQSSVVSLPMGEFDQEESQESLAAAREMANATAKMGISLIPKDIELNVDGKVKCECKPKVTNANLPFPTNSFSADLKFWQGTFVPELMEWVATNNDPFAMNAHPDFHTVVSNLWKTYYTAYKITDVVYAQAAAAVRNWHSKFGKIGLKAIAASLDTLLTIESRAHTFLLADHDTRVSDRHPVGALPISCAAMHKTSACSSDGIKHKGKCSAHSFVAVPWATRAKAYLPGIQKLSTNKWSKIIAMSKPFINSTAQITIDDTDGDESGADSRGLIQIPNDSEDEVVEIEFWRYGAFVAFSPDGKQVVSSSADHTVRIWDVATGEALGASLEGHTGAVFSVAFSPDGKQIVSGSRDQPVRIWDVATGEAVGAPLEGHTNWVRSVAFSPDGKQIVSGSGDQTVHIWDVATREAVGAPLEGHTSSVFSVVFSPDGKQIVSGSDDHTVCIWDVATGEAVGAPLKGHTSVANSVAFSPDGKQVVSGSHDYTVRIWDPAKVKAVGVPLGGQ